MADDRDEIEVDNTEDDSKSIKPPECSYIEEALPDLFELWSKRNEMIFKTRQAVNGENKIEVPENPEYTVKTMHRMSLRAAYNERKSRFLSRPRYRVLPPGPSSVAQSASSELEVATNEAMYWIHRDKDQFMRAVSDVLVVEGGVMRWESNAEAAWPMLIYNEEDGEDEITRKAKSDGDDPAEARERYKKTLGNDSLTKLFSHTYVPLEAYYPFPGPASTEECIEVEFRQVSAVLSNPLFSEEAKEVLKPKGDKNYVSFRDYACIVRYCDKDVYAYYLLPTVFRPAGNQTLLRQLTDPVKKAQFATGIKLLYHYEHHAGMPLYTQYAGAEGGWDDSENEYLIGKLNSTLELSQKLDEIASQELTVVRNSAWPSWIKKYNESRPAQPLNDNDPRKLQFNPTGDVELFVGEEMVPKMQPQNNPYLGPLKRDIVESLAKLTGAPGLFGLHQEGVDGGFQETTLLQQADSLHARTEANIVIGCVNDLLVFYSLVRAKGEKVWVRVPERSQEGRKYFKSVCIDPKKLDPMPVVDATVKAKPAQNVRESLQNYAQATTDVAGPGTAAMDRVTAREQILDIEQPDIMEMRVQVQALLDGIAPPVMAEEIKKKYNLKTVEEQKALAEAANVDAMGLLGEDPLLAGQMAAFANGAPPPMGQAMTPPAPTSMPNASLTQGLGGGLAEGLGQPEQTQGRIEGILEAGALV